MIIIADTSPLISLILIARLDILEKLFEEFFIPEAVWQELNNHTDIKSYKNELNFLSERVKQISNYHFPISGIDRGETESIILYKELKADLLLIDDKKARTIAEVLDVNCVGTLAILYKAKQKGHIEKLKPLFELLLKNSRYYSEKLFNFFLETANESLF